MKDGQLSEKDGRCELRFERPLEHPVDRVWSAITEPDGLAAWFPFDIEGERATGAPLRFVFREGEGETSRASMVEFDPPSVMELRWEDDETLRLEVTPRGSGCVLTLINRFDEIGKAARDARRLARLPRRCSRCTSTAPAVRLDASAGSPSTRATSSASAPKRPRSARQPKGARPLRLPRRTVVAARRRGQTP